MSKYKFKEHLLRKREVYPIKKNDNIFVSVYQGDYHTVRFSIEQGTSVNLRNDKDQTLLHYALTYNQLKIAEFLICHGADLDAKNSKGQTAKEVIQIYHQGLFDLDPNQEVKEIPISGDGENDECCIIC